MLVLSCIGCLASIISIWKELRFQALHKKLIIGGLVRQPLKLSFQAKRCLNRHLLTKWGIRLAKFGKTVLRTIVLGSLALMALCYALVNILDLSIYEMLLLVGTGALLVAILALFGLLFGYVLYAWRRVVQRRREVKKSAKADNATK